MKITHYLAALILLAMPLMAHAQLSAPVGVEFRFTSGYVTTATNDTYSLGETYPISRTPVGQATAFTFGWTTAPVGEVDRINTNPAQLAGGVYYNTVSGAGANFEFDLPSTGTYTIDIAMGDASFTNTQFVKVFDNATLLASYGPVSTGANNFVDISNNTWTSPTLWLSSHVSITHAFTSTHLNILIGAGQTTGASIIAYLLISQSAASCTHNGYSGAWVLPNGSSTSVWLLGGGGHFGVPDCATIPYYQQTTGASAVN